MTDQPLREAVERVTEDATRALTIRWDDPGPRCAVLIDDLRTILAALSRQQEGGEATLSIKVFMTGDASDVQVDFRRDPKGWPVIRAAMIAVTDKLGHELATQDRCPARPRGLEPAPNLALIESEDDALLIFLCELHSNVPEDDRPMSWSAFSDEQAERARRAFRLMLQALSAPPAHRGDTTADRMAHVMRGKLSRGEAIDAEAIDGILELVTAPKPVATEEDREWARRMARDLPPVPHRGDVGREEVATAIQRTLGDYHVLSGRLTDSHCNYAADAVLALLSKEQDHD